MGSEPSAIIASPTVQRDRAALAEGGPGPVDALLQGRTKGPQLVEQLGDDVAVGAEDGRDVSQLLEDPEGDLHVRGHCSQVPCDWLDTAAQWTTREREDRIAVEDMARKTREQDEQRETVEVRSRFPGGQ